jgi:hypothetical protein
MFCGKLPPLNGKGMSKHTLTPEEEAAYADLAAAAARLRRAQARANKRPRRKVRLPRPADKQDAKSQGHIP